MFHQKEIKQIQKKEAGKGPYLKKQEVAALIII
jgi:hypothetical protein